jgi:hypothetical protein
VLDDFALMTAKGRITEHRLQHMQCAFLLGGAGGQGIEIDHGKT